MRFSHYVVTPLPVDKIEQLCKLLRKGTQAYQIISASITDKKMQKSMLALAEESNRYANELYAEVLVTAGMSENPSDDKYEVTADPLLINTEDELGTFCNITETKLVKAYRDVLNESFLNRELRKKINDQLNGTLCSFMNLKYMKISGSKK